MRWQTTDSDGLPTPKQMKKLINAPENVVTDMLLGLVELYPGLSLFREQRVLFRSDIDVVRDTQVALISGGGSGHEPAHGGYIGAGMLSAAAAGEVFTSPTPSAILAAIEHVTGSLGAVLIVKNYTGDRLNFGLAAEIARSRNIPVEMVMVADDVALRGAGEHAGARGLAGTVLVHKIAGALAAEGRSLIAVAEGARSVAAEMATIGLSLSAGTVPTVGKPSYCLAEDEVEMGLGIHGEPGVRRMLLRQADDLADELVQTIVSAVQLRKPERIALMVNNLGATTPMELAIFGGRVVRAVQHRGLKIERIYSGAFMTSLDAAGVSISVLRVDNERLALLDAPTWAPAWPNAVQKTMGSAEQRIVAVRAAPSARGSETQAGRSRLREAISAACDALIRAEPQLTDLDRASGDGDLGVNLARGARAVKAAIPDLPLENAAGTLQAIASLFQETVGGTSGPLYAVMLVRASQSLQGAVKGAGPNNWARAALGGAEAVAELGGAALGDRTMLDALLPFATEFSAGVHLGLEISEALESAVRAAEAGAEATASMVPRRGRASYLGARALGQPDGGAVAVSVWLRAIQEALENKKPAQL